MTEQKTKLLATLIVLRKAIGERHAGYGVLPAHDPVVGAALLAAMEAVGGEQWRPEYTVAWSQAYQIMQDTMLSGVAVAA